MFSSKIPAKNSASAPIAEFQYHPTDVVQQPVDAAIEEAPRDHELRVTEEALRKALAAERASAIAETEIRLRQQYEDRANAETSLITRALERFEHTRKDYFSRVEAEVVKLALSIAGKILHREAQVDPLLVAAVVQIALGQLKEGAAATIRVRPEEVKRWQQHFASQSMNTAVTVQEDAQLEPRDCILETELGSVNFSLDVQLKEVEKGFFDVLAQRPTA